MLLNILFILRVIEGLIMFWGVGKIVYDANRKDRNIHFTNGRAIAAGIIALLWASYTYFYGSLDFINIFLLKNFPQAEAIIAQIGIEIINIVCTTLTAAHLLGYEFRWLKRD